MNKTNVANNRLTQFQFIRFIAFFLIFTGHGYCVYLYIPFKSITPISLAAGSVSLFFILSGFLSAYGAKNYNFKSIFDIKENFNYILKKLKKFYPLYFVTTLFCVCMSPIPRQIVTHTYNSEFYSNITQLLKNLFLIQSWFPTEYYSFNGVGWFLSTIMFMFLLRTPVLTLFKKIENLKYSKNIFIFLLIIFMIIPYVYFFLTRNIIDSKLEFLHYVFPLARTPEYLSGMCLGYLMSSYRKETKYFSNSTEIIIFTLLEMSTLLFWLIMILIPKSVIYERFIWWVFLNVLIIWVFSYGKGLLSQLFKSKIFVYLGDISFECFLIHQIIINLYTVISQGGINTKSTGNIFSFLYCLTITILIAFLISDKSKFAIKMPGNQLHVKEGK